MTRVTLQFLSAQVHRADALIVDDASLHAVGFILAQKDGAVAGIGLSVVALAKADDPGWPERALNTAGITPKAFGATTSTIPAHSVTVTGVPTEAFSKNGLAIPFGSRMQPCDAANGGTYPWCIA